MACNPGASLCPKQIQKALTSLQVQSVSSLDQKDLDLFASICGTDDDMCEISKLQGVHAGVHAFSTVTNTDTLKTLYHEANTQQHDICL